MHYYRFAPEIETPEVPAADFVVIEPDESALEKLVGQEHDASLHFWIRVLPDLLVVRLEQCRAPPDGRACR